MIGHGTADFQAITEQHGAQLGHEFLAGIGPVAIAAFAHVATPVPHKTVEVKLQRPFGSDFVDF
jgi:hypothetical protein